MRILFVSNLFPPHVLGGYEILCAQVRDALRARDHEVHVLTSTHGGDAADADGVTRVLDLETPFHRPARRSRLRRARVTARNAARTRREIERVRPDVVFVWSQLRLTLGAALAAEASGVPVAYTLNDTHLAGFVPSRGGGSLRARVAGVLDRVFAGSTLDALRLRRTTCISAALRDALAEAGVPVAGTRVIHQGLPLERFPAWLDRPRHPGPARVLYAGQLHPYKGVHTVLEAAGRLRAVDGVPLEVSIAGDGPADYVARLRSLAAASGQPVAFLGRVAHDALPAVYRRHDALVFPSIWREPFGLTHLEAMASGTPVVSTVEGGPREFLEHGGNALVFRADDAEDLAVQLGRLLADDGLARRLARAGRRCVEERFTLTRYVRDLESFLAEAA